MSNSNKANREVCDVIIRYLSTMTPFLKFDTANTTTTGLESDGVYAMAKGARKIAFANPLEGTLTIEAQVYPFKFFALLSDGSISSDAVYDETKTIKATENGKLTITAPSNGTIEAGTVFAYPKGSFGDEGSEITGTYADGVFTATDGIEADKEYEVGYMVNRTAGVKRISFNNKKLPKDYYITMLTNDKDEEGVLTPFIMTAYKAAIQRNFELSFSSEGDPASVSITFDLLEDSDGNTLDMIELTED